MSNNYLSDNNLTSMGLFLEGRVVLNYYIHACML